MEDLTETEETRKYSYKVICSNCGKSHIEKQKFGTERPVKVFCQTCGCLANTYSE